MTEEPKRFLIKVEFTASDESEARKLYTILDNQVETLQKREMMGIEVRTSLVELVPPPAPRKRG